MLGHVEEATARRVEDLDSYFDNLYEGVAVYGADGRMKLFNPGLSRIWGLDPDFLRGEPHETRQPWKMLTHHLWRQVDYARRE